MNYPANGELVTDVIVVGAGFAGLSAAIEAAKAGAKVLVVEKTALPGGNSLISEGSIAAPGTDIQARAAIIDSPELMAKDMMVAGEGLCCPELVKTLTDKAREAFYWCRDYLGIKYLERVDLFRGHSAARCYTPEVHSGSSLIKAQLARLSELKVPVRTNTMVQDLLSNKRGKVLGVRVIEDYRKTESTQSYQSNLWAEKAVIVAAGGFGSDVDFRRAQDPRLDASVMSTNRRSATAEMLQTCLRFGANALQLQHIQLGPWASPDEKGFGLGPLFRDYAVVSFGLIIDPSTSTRFVNELTNRKDLADAILERGHPVLGIADQAAVNTIGWDLNGALRKGVIKTFNTFEEISIAYDLDYPKFESLLNRFNEAIRLGDDKEFQKPILPNALPLVHPPYYVMRLWPKVHYTMGGLQIDASARVMHREQYPIPGLYAAGEVTGGIHGACRLGSCAITDCLVMGRIAGKGAAFL